MTLGLSAVLLLALAVPRRLDLERAPAALAATICFLALLLRALTAIFFAIFVVLFLPATELFTLLSHWCIDAVIPFIADHLPLDGHAVGDAALVAPSFALVVSVLSVTFGLWQAARRVGELMSKRSIGPGPRDSLILGDGDVVVAAAGFRRPRILISAGALVAFDDEELDASLEHEQGHISRNHRFVLVAAEVCRALARFLPGTAATADELRYHLERDADDYAVRRHHEPSALASAICKAATAQLGGPALALSGGPVTRRLGRLLDGPPAVSARRLLGLRLCAGVLTVLVATSIAALPAATAAGVRVAETGGSQHACYHDGAKS